MQWKIDSFRNRNRLRTTGEAIQTPKLIIGRCKGEKEENGNLVTL